MSAKWNKGPNPDVIVNKLAAIRTLDGDKVSFRGWEYEEYIATLKSMIELDDNFSSEIAQSLIMEGFREAAKKKELTKLSIITAVKKAVREHLNKPLKKYRLVTTLNIDIESLLPKYKLNGCSLVFHKKLPKKFVGARNEFLSEASSWLVDKDELYSHYLIASIEEKSPHDAVDKMLDNIDLLRGIWNLHVNKAMVFSFGGRKKPVNQITLGAIHTLHDNSGRKINDTYWYQPEYVDSLKRVKFSDNDYKTLEFTKNVRKLLKNHTYKQEIETSLVRYVRALDSQDYNSVFIKLWSVLEYLTCTLKDSYDKTIKRTAFHFKDREYHRLVLEQLRQYRNKSVHLGAGESDIEVHVYQLKNYVEHLLKFHIRNHFKFKSMHETAKFMDLRPEISALKEQIALCKAGIHYLY